MGKPVVMLTCSKCGERFDRGYRISMTRWAKPQYCSSECRASKPDKACGICGKLFRPRSVTKTKYCSIACSAINLAANVTDDTKAARAEGLRKAHREGRIEPLRGADKPNWKGGKEAFQERRKEVQRQRNATGEAAAALRAYRKANPDKVREFSVRRKGRKLDRLPRGSLPRIREAQRNKCAICRVSLKSGSHMNHIMPLARGGKHEPRNIQFLCGHCNVTKNARDPIEHMQSLGRLL
jgi:5-methylcytosine-specific restriction endonuclease McrA